MPLQEFCTQLFNEERNGLTLSSRLSLNHGDMCDASMQQWQNIVNYYLDVLTLCTFSRARKWSSDNDLTMM